MAWCVDVFRLWERGRTVVVTRVDNDMRVNRLVWKVNVQGLFYAVTGSMTTYRSGKPDRRLATELKDGQGAFLQPSLGR